MIIDPEMVAAQEDTQLILPLLVRQHTALWVQVVFFGALLSAIMSTASGAILAPSVSMTENVLKPFLRGRLKDRQQLWLTRAVVATFALCVTVFAMVSDNSIYGMVENSNKVTLVSAVAPLVAGMFWRRANTQGALASIVVGSVVWVALEAVAAPGDAVPPQLAGFLASALALVAGSLAPPLALLQRGHDAEAVPEPSEPSEQRSALLSGAAGAAAAPDFSALHAVVAGAGGGVELAPAARGVAPVQGPPA